MPLKSKAMPTDLPALVAVPRQIPFSSCLRPTVAVYPAVFKRSVTCASVKLLAPASGGFSVAVVGVDAIGATGGVVTVGVVTAGGGVAGVGVVWATAIEVASSVPATAAHSATEVREDMCEPIGFDGSMNSRCRRSTIAERTIERLVPVAAQTSFRSLTGTNCFPPCSPLGQ